MHIGKLGCAKQCKHTLLNMLLGHLHTRFDSLSTEDMKYDNTDVNIIYLINTQSCPSQNTNSFLPYFTLF